ncbi:DUF3015 family protein [Fluviispira sanaruensis]|uniref:DUF3015 domain-containing protein n=1 Tax=Fluviispira sanaruensis TaxID=2493639 RepID=A0A4P2VJA0_FLUSA|nr:DUF3015 family protein [Fluviispira sanaruensis]BBH51994.1 DUF3015 domain-containing protein [Fluviispira sanaruensis]
MFLRKHVPITFVLCLLPFASIAKTPFGMAGCGLGSQVMGADGNQVFASTTNGTLANQVFGITSGTSNCLAPSKAAALSAQKKFISDNYSTLSKEMAQGDGETLRAFSSTFGCKNELYPRFASQMQNSFSKIFIAPGVMAALDVVQEEIKGNEELVSGCSLVI